MKLLYPLTALALSMAVLTSCGEVIEDINPSSETTVDRSNFISIGTSGVTGTYYPTGGAICRIVKMSETPFRCTVESTGGSLDNVNMIKTGEFDFGISQSDTAYYAYNGQGEFQDEPVDELRSIIAIYPELLALVVRDDANIELLNDIKEKRINLDVKDSGTNMTTKLLLEANNIDLNDVVVTEFKTSDGLSRLKEGSIDGYFGMFGHPTANVAEAVGAEGANLVPIFGSSVNNLVAEHPYYAKGMILADDYEGLTKDVPSYGVKAVLITRSDVNNEAVAAITQSMLDHFDEFKELHPAYAHTTKASLLEGLAIPQHPAATAVFEDAGLSVKTS